MFNNTALDVFIGIVFIFLLYSLLATIIQEMIATRFAFRAKILEKAILRMLEDGITTSPFAYADRLKGILHIFGLKSLLKGKEVAAWFYAHPLIKYLGEDNYYSKPAYLDASNFSKVMLDLLKGFGQPESQAVQSIHNSVTAGIIHKLPINISTAGTDKINPAIKVLNAQNANFTTPSALASETVPLNPNTALFLRSLWQDSGADINVFKTKLEEWFDDTMDRASGWYKKYTRIVLFVIGLVVAISFNVDTIAIHRILSTNKTAREQMVQMAIANKDNLDPKKILNDSTHMQSDSLLNATYKIVADDALKANDILGLGRPWADSCKTCKAFKDTSKVTLARAKLDSLKNENTNIDKCRQISFTLKAITDSLNKKSDSLKKLNKNSNNSAIALLIFQIKNTDSLKRVNDTILSKHNSKGLSDSINKLTILVDRCPFIIKETKTWFKYSPNQSGGWETFFGWLITALAVTLGAPFWFDLLSKLISLRGSGSKITPTDDDSNNKKNTPATPANAANPVTVNVNPNPGEEAVG